MDWNRIRQQWQIGDDVAARGDDAELLAAVRKRERDLRAAVVRRDRIESIVAVLLAPVFGYAAWRAGLREAWASMFFSAWLTLWVTYVPWHFWRVRRRMPQARPELAPGAFLALQRDAMLAQARMLEQIWVWYLAPCAIGVIGLNFAAQGATTGTLVYTAIVLGFCAILARLNHRAARVQFRDLAAQIERQIERLSEENET